LSKNRLKPLKLGDRDEAVKKLHDFLKSFGYMKSDKKEILGYKIDFSRAAEISEKEDMFDTNTSKAVTLYQEFNKLPVTGTVDEETLKLMSKPRCGVPDIVETKSEFAVTTPWSKTTLTYSFQNFTGRLTESVIRKITDNMLKQWASVSPLEFCEVSSGGDIKIGWFVGDHGDGNPFDGPSGIFGHGFFPEDGRVHFDDDEGWTDSNLPPVAIHEFGHSVGMLHSQVPNTVMWGSYTGLSKLQPDDISGIQSLYGPAVPISVNEILASKGISFPASIINVVDNLGLNLPISIRQLICHLRHS
jgi:hypothetical protein